MTATGFRHEALFYEGDDGFVAGTVPFIRDGVAGGEAVLVVVGAEKIDLLRRHVDGDGLVDYADMADVGRNPACIIPAWQEFVDANAGRPFRGIGEPIHPDRRPAELVECHRHESLLNLAFSDGPAWTLLCPYDTAALDGPVIAEARRNHPFLVAGGACAESPTYSNGASGADLAAPLPPAPPHARALVFSDGPLWRVRRFVGEEAAAAGLDRAAVANLALSANEVVTNSIRHGAGGGVLLVWHDDTAVVCEVRDAGRVDEPMIGRVRPAPDGESGRGMWLANHLTDLVQVRSSADGTVVRIHMWR